MMMMMMMMIIIIISNNDFISIALFHVKHAQLR